MNAVLFDYTKVRKVHLNKSNKAYGIQFDAPPVGEHIWRGKDIHGNVDFLTADNYFSACALFERRHPECYTRENAKVAAVTRVDPSSSMYVK